MRWLTVIFAAFLALVLQMTLAERIAIGGVGPDFVLLLIVFLVMGREGGLYPIIIGFSIGFLQDLQNPSFLGLNALCKTLTAFATAKIAFRMAHDHPLFQSLLIMAAVIAHDLIYLPVFTGLEFGEIFLYLFRQTIPTALYTAVIGTLILNLAKFLTMGGNRFARRA